MYNPNFQEKLKIPHLAPGAIPVKIKFPLKRSLPFFEPEITESLSLPSKIPKQTLDLERIYNIMQNSLPHTWSIILPSNLNESLVFSSFSTKINESKQHTLVPYKEIFLTSDGTLSYNYWGISLNTKDFNHFPSTLNIESLENFKQCIHYFHNINNICVGFSFNFANRVHRPKNLLIDNLGAYHSQNCQLPLEPDNSICNYCTQAVRNLNCFLKASRPLFVATKIYQVRGS